MKRQDVVRSWGRILQGRTPALSIELTRECPLACPGCYAYGPEHLGGGLVLREVSDLKGQELVQGVLRLVDERRPLHVSIVGGEPLVRARELDVLLPALTSRGVHVQVVTSAVRPIPAGWALLPHLTLTVSVDGLQPEHDARRKPATYERILRNIDGHQVTVHCTVTRQQARPGYLASFARFWGDQASVGRIWFSLYTPQQGEQSEERLRDADRRRVLAELAALRAQVPKIDLPEAVLEGYRRPPASPAECVFAQTTHCVSADLERTITPCQFGGHPECGECGCVASAGLAAVSRYRLAGIVPVHTIFDASLRIGRVVGRLAATVPVPDKAAAEGRS